ncbi:gamma-glutamylcyclotransferase [Aestuariivirga sp.]|uniref:gamma-glutamylcyclotransferase n=1 Tax=Aestuariivirga sp. TaxID=2650926 RepID=UPI0039E5AFAD
MAKPAARLHLTAEHVARVERTEADPGPEPGTEEFKDHEYDEWAARLMADHRGGDVWVFAYGSLIWNPVFEFSEQRRAVAHGWHRAFCLRMARWRGTHDLPCLMMALDRGGSCTGIAYRLPPEDHLGQVRRLLIRELDDKPASNVPRWITAQTARGPLQALTFVALKNGRSYVKDLTPKRVAHTLARAAGDLGSAAQYLFRTVSMLEEHGIRDRNLWELQRLVAKEIDGMDIPENRKIDGICPACG